MARWRAFDRLTSTPKQRFSDEVILFADADGAFKAVDEDGVVSALAGAGSLPNPTDEGDVLTVVDGSWGGAPSGGSQPGVRRTAAFLFTEPAAPHADMVATFDVLANGRVLDVVFVPLVVTFADSLTLTVGDTAEPAGYFDEFQVGPSGFWNPYDPTTTSGFAGTDFDVQGNQTAAYKGAAYFPDQGNSESVGVFYDTDDTITMTVAGIATGGGGGVFQILIDYLDPVSPVAFA